MRRIACCLVALALLLPGAALAEESDTCPNGRSKNAAWWYSLLKPGLGEWYLNGWGSFQENAPPKKFWLGLIPGYGWPGYLMVKSARDAGNCSTNDGLKWSDR